MLQPEALENYHAATLAAARHAVGRERHEQHQRWAASQNKLNRKAPEDGTLGCPGGYCWGEQEPTTADIPILLRLGASADSPDTKASIPAWAQSSLAPIKGDLSKDPSMVCLTRVALQAVAEGLDSRRVGAPDGQG